MWITEKVACFIWKYGCNEREVCLAVDYLWPMNAHKRSLNGLKWFTWLSLHYACLWCSINGQFILFYFGKDKWPSYCLIMGNNYFMHSKILSQLLYSTLCTTNNHKGYCSLNINSRLNGVNSAKPKEKIQTRWAKNRVRARDNENFNVYIQRTQVLSSSSSSSRLVPKGKLFSSFTLTWMHNLKFQIFNKKIIFCLFFVHQLIDPLPQILKLYQQAHFPMFQSRPHLKLSWKFCYKSGNFLDLIPLSKLSNFMNLIP